MQRSSSLRLVAIAAVVLAPAFAVAADFSADAGLADGGSLGPKPAAARATLENPAALARFFAALARLATPDAHADVRVAQFGDSHTAADFATSAVRRDLQARFGDGGRGFVAIGRPFAYYIQDGVRCGMAPPWTALVGKVKDGQVVGDGLYGLAGAAVASDSKRTRAWVDIAMGSSQLDVAYLAQPRGGTFDLLVDGARAARIPTRHSSVASAFKSVTVPDGPHHIEVQPLGDGEVRVFGVAADRPEAGVVLDALGIIGARIGTMLTWSERHMAEQLRHRTPDLVVLAYGTNEAGDDTDADTYEQKLVTALGRIARAAPMASCLLLGPPDRAALGETGWVTVPRLAEVTATQRRVAKAAGCAFYDQQAAMGGPGSIAQWAEATPPRAQRDRVHLTRDGYAELGHAFATELLAAYALR